MTVINSIKTVRLATRDSHNKTIQNKRQTTAQEAPLVINNLTNRLPTDNTKTRITRAASITKVSNLSTSAISRRSLNLRLNQAFRGWRNARATNDVQTSHR